METTVNRTTERVKVFFLCLGLRVKLAKLQIKTAYLKVRLHYQLQRNKLVDERLARLKERHSAIEKKAAEIYDSSIFYEDSSDIAAPVTFDEIVLTMLTRPDLVLSLIFLWMATPFVRFWHNITRKK